MDPLAPAISHLFSAVSSGDQTEGVFIIDIYFDGAIVKGALIETGAASSIVPLEHLAIL